jgi:uncharacterized protein (TIGR02611 family)
LNEFLSKGVRHAKRVITAVVGFTLILIGLVMTVLPGPAFLVIPLGLAVLATEFVWARRLLKKVKSAVMNNSLKTKKDHKDGV